jgi:hypothetical protein
MKYLREKTFKKIKCPMRQKVTETKHPRNKPSRRRTISSDTVKFRRGVVVVFADLWRNNWTIGRHVN